MIEWKKGPAHVHALNNGLPEQIALGSSVYLSLRGNGLRSLVWPRIMLEVVSMSGGLLRADQYHTTNVSQDGISIHQRTE